MIDKEQLQQLKLDYLIATNEMSLSEVIKKLLKKTKRIN
jgi:predicted CopG family antitoxin